MQEETLSTSAQTANALQTPAHPHRHTSALFHHEPRQHKPRNANLLHEAERAAAGLNEKIALWLTRAVGTMLCAYIFGALAILGFPGLVSPAIASLVSWASQTFIQLTMLSVIMVGQAVLGRKQEIQADEQFNTTVNTYHDIEQIMEHLIAQDNEILRQSKMIIHLLEKNGVSLEQLETEVGHVSRLESYTEKLSTNTPTTPATIEDTK
ncbi:MAG: hypothetical protein ABI234_12030 [Ktedonobacteraceae bacterium]